MHYGHISVEGAGVTNMRINTTSMLAAPDRVEKPIEAVPRKDLLQF
jgi:hypothetical protein